MNFDLAAALTCIVPGRPLVITDADGVLLQFTGGLKRHLEAMGLYLDLTDYRFTGAVKRRDDGSTLLDVEVQVLVDEFRRDLDDLDAVDGAPEALKELAKAANIVVLSNINERQAAARRRNLKAIGLDFPLIANDTGQGYLGGKGAVVKALAARAGTKTFFIDDLPVNLLEVAKAVPEVTLVHLVESATLQKLLGRGFQAHCYANNWAEAHAYILSHLT